LPAAYYVNPFPVRSPVMPVAMWPALPSSEYYELIRLPNHRRRPSFVVGISYLVRYSVKEQSGPPKFLCVSLYTCHALLPRQDLRTSPLV